MIQDENSPAPPPQTTFTQLIPDPSLQYQKTPVMIQVTTQVPAGPPITYQQAVLDVNGEPVLDEDGVPETTTVTVPAPMVPQTTIQPLTTGAGQMLHLVMWGDLVAGGIDAFLTLLQTTYVLFNGYPPTTDAELLAVSRATSEWGLGCPGGCGAFYPMVSTVDLTQWKLKNPDQKPALNWVKDSTGIQRVYKCGLCGVQITLAPEA